MDIIIHNYSIMSFVNTKLRKIREDDLFLHCVIIFWDIM